MNIFKISFLFFLIIPFLSNAQEYKVICNGENIQIGPRRYNANSCFKWISNDGSLSCTECPNPNATPNKTTEYILQFFDDINPNQKIGEYKETVIVIESLTLEITNIEVNGGNAECMEGRALNFLALADVDLPIGFNNSVNFDFHFSSLGQELVQSEMSFDASVVTTYVVPNIPGGGALESFDLTSFVTISFGETNCQSNTINVEVFTMKIAEIKDDFYSGTSRKIIVGKEFYYEATGSKDCILWDWDMSDQYNGQNAWNTNFLSEKKGIGQIPSSDLPIKNDKFGTNYSTITVSCFDGAGRKFEFSTNDLSIYYWALDTSPFDSSVPNWFYYYKDAFGGGSYGYDPNRLTSRSSPGRGESTILIANNAYSGGTYIVTNIINGQLTVLGRSSIMEYYPYFVGVVTHEREHALNQCFLNCPHLDPDGDNDWLTNSFELSHNLNPNDRYSAGGNIYGPKGTDGEVYAGGPIEKDAINGADTSVDWAVPGTNWK